MSFGELVEDRLHENYKPNPCYAFIGHMFVKLSATKAQNWDW
jgi:hypothetical protein